MKRLKVVAAVFLASIILTSTGCTLKGSQKVKTKYTIQAKELTSSVDTISSANNKVAFKFLNETVKAGKGENIVISPLSLNTVMALTQNGAAGIAKAEMLQALELKGIEDELINESYRNIIAHLNSLKTINVKMGNSIWIAKGMQVREEYKNIGRDFYEAEINEVDFLKKKTTDTINNWVSSQTAGKVRKIMDAFDPDTRMALINTVYFKAKWSTPFKESSTEKQKFTSTAGITKDVDLMKESLGVEYLKGRNFEAIRLPYEDNNFGMYVFLPNKGNNVDALIKDINHENWNQWLRDFAKKEVMVKLPKFKLEYEKELNDMLQGFGMKTAFGMNADFSKMSDKNSLYIDLVKQKCFIEVNESGTEAAAATVVVMKETSAAMDKPIVFTADRPFVYAIADKKTGLILFMGKVEMP